MRFLPIVSLIAWLTGFMVAEKTRAVVSPVSCSFDGERRVHRRLKQMTTDPRQDSKDEGDAAPRRPWQDPAACRPARRTHPRTTFPATRCWASSAGGLRALSTGPRRVTLKRRGPQGYLSPGGTRTVNRNGCGSWRRRRLSAALHNPGIVQVHDFGTSGELPTWRWSFARRNTRPEARWQATAPARGGPVGRADRQSRPSGEAGQGIVRRKDLKPGNVFLASDGTPKVGDFSAPKVEVG